MREIASLIPRFLRSHPGMTIDLGLNDRRVDLIEEGWDIAVRNRRNGRFKSHRAETRPRRTLVCASPAYLEEKGTPQTIDELTVHNCLGYTLSKSVGVKHWQFGDERKISVPVSGSLTANNGDTLVAAGDCRAGHRLPSDLPGCARD